MENDSTRVFFNGWKYITEKRITGFKFVNTSVVTHLHCAK